MQPEMLLLANIARQIFLIYLGLPLYQILNIAVKYTHCDRKLHWQGRLCVKWGTITDRESFYRPIAVKPAGEDGGGGQSKDGNQTLRDFLN